MFKKLFIHAKADFVGPALVVVAIATVQVTTIILAFG